MDVADALKRNGVCLAPAALADYCKRWKINRLEVFGSALRDDFTPSSDIDFLVTFDDHARWTLFDLVDAENELAHIAGRPVDLVERPPIVSASNRFRRDAILGSARALYVA